MEQAGAKRPPEQAPEGDAFAQDWRWAPAAARKKQRGGGAVSAGGAGAEPAVAWGNPDVAKDAATTVYVRNLPYAATYGEVEALFAQAGKVCTCLGRRWNLGRYRAPLMRFGRRCRGWVNGR